jgi:copper transport protein
MRTPRASTSLLLALLFALGWPAAAWAHATLKQESPQFEQRFESSPRRVVLGFDQGVKALPNSIEVYTARGKIVSGPARSAPDPRKVVAPLRRVAKGGYTVRWHAISSDGHVVSGVFTFGVRQKAPTPTQAYGASGPTRTEHVVRWLYFAALALLVGGIGFRLLVLPKQIPAALERRFYVVTGIGAIAVIHVGIAAFVLRAEDALQLPFGKLLYGDLTPIAEGTRFGKAFVVMTLGFAWLAGLLFFAWLTDRRTLLWPALAIGLVLASGLSLSGHSAADRGSSCLSQLADWVHLSAATLWVGGVIQLALCVWPLAPELRRSVFVRFARLAPVLITLIVCAGVYLSILRLPHLHDLWTQDYGRVLLVKLGLVTAALAWGGFHHFVVRPRLAAGGGGWVRRSLLGESVVATAILLLAAILVDSKPPPAPQPATRTSLVSSVNSSPPRPP